MDAMPTNEDPATTSPLLVMPIHTPDQRVHVFVSSTIKELAEERRAVIDAIRQLGQTPIYFESGARPYPPRETYQTYLDKCQIFVGIYWQSYGSVIRNMSISGIEDEYDQAASKPELLKLLYVKKPAPERDERLNGLLDRIRTDNLVCYKEFSTAKGLQEQVKTDIALLLAGYFYIASKALDAQSQAHMSAVIAHSKLAQYRQRVEEDTRFVNLLGISRGMPIQVPLDKVYIQLQASAQKPDVRSKESEIPKPNKDGARPPTPETLSTSVLNRLRAVGEHLYRRQEADESTTRSDAIHPADALRKHGRLVILGAPGAGKSTLLRYLARKSASDVHGPLPILVSLREYATRLDNEPALSIRSFALTEAAVDDIGLREALDAEVEQGRVIWLLDGLDEVRGWTRRTSTLISHLPGQVIVTSRPVGFESTGLESFAQFDVLPLSPDDVSRFLQDWFGLLAEQQEESPEQVNKQVAHLREQLRLRPRIESLLRNPLLLTFLTILIGQDPSKELPYERAELYRLYVEGLIASWEERRVEGSGNSVKFSLGPLQLDTAPIAALEGFYYLGWYLHSVYYGGLKRHGVLARPIKQEVIDALADYYEANQNWDLDKGNLRAVSRATVNFWLEAGVLDLWVADAEEYLFFRHMTFQEYAAAHQLAAMWKTNAMVAWKEVIRPVLHHYAWHETLLLLAGQLDGDNLNNLARRVLRSRSYLEHTLHRDLRMAASIIGQASSVDEKLVYHVTKRLARLIEGRAYNRSLGVSLICLIYLLGSTVVGGLLVSNWFAGVIATLWLFGSLVIGVFIWFMFLLLLRSLVGVLLSPYGIIPIAIIFATLSGGFLGTSIIWAAIWSLLWYGAFVFPGHAKLHGILCLPLRIQPAIPDTLPFIHALAQVSSKHVTDLLISMLKGDDFKIREGAARALIATRRDPGTVELVSKYAFGRNIQDEFYTALRYIDAQEKIERLIQIIEADASDVDAAIKGLGIVGDARAVDLLLDILNKYHLEGFFTEIENNNQLNYFGDILGMESTFSRIVSVIHALGQIGDARAVRPIRQMYHDYGPHNLPQRIREYLQDDVSPLDDEEITAWESILVEDYNVPWRIRYAAVEALGLIGNQEVVPTLICALTDESKSEHHVPTLRIADAAVQSLARMDSALVLEPLMQLISDKRSEIAMCARALEVFGYIGDETVSNILVNILSNYDEPHSLRCAAAKALGKRRDRKAVPMLVQALSDKDQEYLWEAALTTLGQIADPQAIESLVSFLHTLDPQSKLRPKVIVTLGQIGGSGAVTVLLQSLQDFDPQFRIATVEALSLTDDPRALEAIKRVLRESASQSDLKVAAVRALGLRRHPDAMDALLKSLHDNDPFRVYFSLLDDDGKAEDDARNVRKVAAEALMGSISTVLDPNKIRKICRALWWRTTDRQPLGNAAMQALERAANHLAVVEVNEHSITDPFTAEKAKTSIFKR